MSRTVHITTWVSLLFACFFLIYWIKFYQNEIVSFDEWVLEKQVNYAADSAVDELLFSSDTDQDYNKGEYALVDPDLAVNDYCEILATCFNMPVTSKSSNIIKTTYIKALIICTYDGVYAYWPQTVDSTGNFDLVGTPKIPYFYEGNNGKSYCLNLGYDKAYFDTYDKNGAMTQDNYNLMKYDVVDLAPDVQKSAINALVSDVTNFALEKSYTRSSNTNSKEVFEIPALASEIKGSQPVDGITVIGVVEGNLSSAASVITAKSIGGARIITNDPYIGCCLDFGPNDNHSPVYARSSYWKANLEKLKQRFPNIVNDLKSTGEYFDTPFDAATCGVGAKNKTKYGSIAYGYYDLLTRMEDL